MSQHHSELKQTTSVSELRSLAWQEIRNGLRPGQQQMADWKEGPLAISAVPGAGKSKGMAAAAALAIARQYADKSQLNRRQLIVVTFTRSAAANLKAKIRADLKKLSLPISGFAVHTLHGLALNIASRYPDISGLQLDTSTLITPNQSHRLIRTCVEQWIAIHPGRYERLLEGNISDGEETERLRRQSVLRTEVLPDLAATVIHEAKSSGLSPEDLRLLSTPTDDYAILSVAAGLYEQYQNLMRSRDFIDYDDMILAALRVLSDNSARRLEQNQVFAVFEDEAQDSSPLQTRLLEILAADPNSDSLVNLVRVGDPNQAINSTFTPADPIYFRSFCQQCDRIDRLATMDRAGRSTSKIIDAANFTLAWVNRAFDSFNDEEKHSTEPKFELPFLAQEICLVDANDPQADANPPQIGRGLELYTPRDIHHTVELLSQRVIQVFSLDPKTRAAILVRENRQGRWLASALTPICQEHNIELYDVGERERHSHVPAEILALLQFCDRPHSSDYLKATLEVLVKRQLIPTQDLNALAAEPEQFLYPGPLAQPQTEPVYLASHLCRSLLRARLELPYYQLISFLALALKYEPAELATADKLAARVTQQISGSSSLSSMLDVLSEIVSSERFEPVEIGDSEARYTREGQLTIITMHKAKGLDWDCVFLPFLHENLLPGKFWIPPQTQFLGDFTLAEVARAQIRAVLHGNKTDMSTVTTAWESAKNLKLAEEYRLLYVAMTRAKRLLWMSAAQKAPFTWSKPENLQSAPPCPVFPALKRQFPASVISLATILQ